MAWVAVGKVGNAVVKRWSSREAIRRTAKPLVHPFVLRPAGQSVGLVIHRSRSDVHGRAKRATAYTRCATRTHHARRSRAGQRPEGRGAGKPALLCSSEFEGARANCIRFAHPPLPRFAGTPSGCCRSAAIIPVVRSMRWAGSLLVCNKNKA